MHYNLLGNTPLQVSRICLGTMTWGEQNTEEQAHQQLDYAISQGVNFIDTAEAYPVPPRFKTRGLTEIYIGKWLKQRQCRDKIILATKVAGPGEIAQHIRKGPRLSRSHILEAIDSSLLRLQTDYIDLYQLHWPERNTNFFGKLGYVYDENDAGISLLESLSALGELVTAGKVRYIGVSNETPWGVMTYLKLAEQHHLPKIVTVQNPYNLLNRVYEVGLAEISQREQIGLLAYSPLGFGALTGKYLNHARPAGARLTLFERFSRYTNEYGVRATENYVQLARQQGLSPAQMALAYVNSRPFLTSTIIGATTLEQLQENIGSIELTLTPEVITAIEAIHEYHPNPCP
jgi:aryl-alcohol dehydrogenase-like predicted oxidoreductase